MRTLLAGMLLVLGGVAVADTARAGTIEVTSRVSYGAFDIIAGSFGAVDRIKQVDELNTLNGDFSFAQEGTVDVVDSDPYSRGAAYATGLLSFSDSVSQPGASSLRVEAQRTAISTLAYVEGRATATAHLEQTLQLDFSVLGGDVFFEMSGSFDPGALSNNTRFSGGQFLLSHRGSPKQYFFYDAPGQMAASGVLAAGSSYRLLLRMTDNLKVDSGNAQEFDNSSVNFLFTVSPVPEPAPALMFGAGLAGLLLYRRQHARIRARAGST
jgi:hypothetical protein